MKKCGRCKETKPATEFSLNRTKKDGLQPWCKVCKSKHYAANREAIALQNKEYSAKNRDKIRNRKAAYNASRREKIAAYNADYYASHKAEVNAQQCARRSRDAQFKLQCYLRSQLWGAIKGSLRHNLAVSNLGCSIDELKGHIEAQFEPGMTWDNWARDGWHIDHIIPLSAFDLTDREQLKQACRYTNVRPLWYKTNIRKGAKVPTKRRGQ